MLLPAGALLPLIMNRKIKWQEALVFGVLISATIETSQLITMRGLFEWDEHFLDAEAMPLHPLFTYKVNLM
ncbi:VanZ family protein [Blautia obeum]|nr:VanZ family protein [Blautia obeum]